MAKNGFRIFDTDTHVGPSMDVLETVHGRRRARQARAVRRATARSPSAPARSPTAWARASTSVASDAPSPAWTRVQRRLHGRLHRRPQGPRARPDRRPRRPQPHRGHGLRRRRRQPAAALRLVRRLHHRAGRVAGAGRLPRLQPLDGGLLRRVPGPPRRRDPALRSRHRGRPGRSSSAAPTSAGRGASSSTRRTASRSTIRTSSRTGPRPRSTTCRWCCTPSP